MGHILGALLKIYDPPGPELVLRFDYTCSRMSPKQLSSYLYRRDTHRFDGPIYLFLRRKLRERIYCSLHVFLSVLM